MKQEKLWILLQKEIEDARTKRNASTTDIDWDKYHTIINVLQNVTMKMY